MNHIKTIAAVAVPLSPSATGCKAPGDAALSPEAAGTSVLAPPEALNIRSLSLLVLATLAGIYTLHWASAVFIPLMLGVLCSYGLSPVVDWLQLRRVPRSLSSALLIAGLLGGLGGTAYALSDDASRLVELLPQAAQRLHDAVRKLPGTPDSTFATMQKAASKLEQAAEDVNDKAPLTRGVQRVQIEKPKFAIQDYLWNGTLSLVAMVSQLGVISLITFFLMASGDSFRRKLVRLAGPTLASRRITLEALNEVTGQIQRYLQIQLLTSLMVGVATWLAFLALGVEHAAVWGVAAGVLDLVPYIGGAIVAGGSALVSFTQFGSAEMALLVAGVSLFIHAAEGFLLTPWLTSRAGKMSPVAVFVGLMAWGWLWGAWGLLLGVPMLMMIKAVCDRLDGLKPVGEFLSA